MTKARLQARLIIFNIITFPPQQWLRERAATLRYT